MRLNVDASDHHNNIFYYYSGNTSRTADKDEVFKERQLENNTTKALINTLAYCSSSVQKQFLQWLEIETKGPCHYRLQARTIPSKWISKKGTKIVLGIIPPYAQLLDQPSVDSKVNEAARDAWIFGDGWVILIESKVSGDLNKEQIRSHLTCLGTQSVFRQKTWEDIHHLFQIIKGEKLQTIDTFLLGQFCDYLEVTALAGFTGIKKHHFEYFINKDDSDQNSDVRRMMNALASKIKNAMNKKLKDSYPNFKLGKVTDACWGAFYEGARRQDSAHITIELWSDRFQVFANVETQQGVKKLRKQLKQDRPRFEDIIKKLPEGYSVSITDRIPGKRPRDYEYKRIKDYIVGDLHSRNKTGKQSLNELVESCQTVKYPQFSIRRDFTRDDVIYKGPSFVNDIVETMKDLHDFVEFVNDQ
jgi:uncharacterized protein YktB (UPF0637 family)